MRRANSTRPVVSKMMHHPKAVRGEKRTSELVNSSRVPKRLREPAKLVSAVLRQIIVGEVLTGKYGHVRAPTRLRLLGFVFRERYK